MRMSSSTTSGRVAGIARQRLLAVAGRRDDVDLRLERQQAPDSLAHERLVLDEQDADHDGSRATGRIASTAKPRPGAVSTESGPRAARVARACPRGRGPTDRRGAAPVVARAELDALPAARGSRATRSRRPRAGPRSSRSPARSAGRSPATGSSTRSRRRSSTWTRGRGIPVAEFSQGGGKVQAPPSRSVPTASRTSPSRSFVTDWAVSTRFTGVACGQVARDLEVQRQRGQVVAEQVVQLPRDAGALGDPRALSKQLPRRLELGVGRGELAPAGGLFARATARSRRR